MCVIIVKPIDSTLSKEQLKSCYENNPDGMGYMYAKDGKVIADKFVPNNFEEVWDVWESLSDKEAVIHFRWLTTGVISVAHSHPFRVLKKSKKTPDLFMMHNGTFKVTTKEGENDTIAFKNQILKPTLSANPSLLDDDKFLDMIEGMDSWSRLALLDGEGNLTMTRAKQWVERGKCLLSNSYSLTKDHRKPPKTWAERQKEKEEASLKAQAEGKPINGWKVSECGTREIWYNNMGVRTNCYRPIPSAKRKNVTGSPDLRELKPEGITLEKDDTTDVETSDGHFTQELLKSMPEEELLKWVVDDSDSAIHCLLTEYPQHVLATHLAFLGLCYADTPEERDVEEFVTGFPEEAVDFFKDSYYRLAEDYDEETAYVH